MENNNCVICNSKIFVTKSYVEKSINKKRFFSYCDYCRHISVVPLPTSEELDLYYLNSKSQIDSNYIKAYKKNKLPRFKALIEKYSNQKSKSILEIGPGSIGILSIISKSDNYSVLEYSKKNIENLKEEARLFGKSVVSYNNFKELSQAQENFDIVLCNAMLEHSNDPKSFLENINPYIKPGGIFIIGVPDRIFEIPFVNNFLICEDPINFNEQHLHSFTYESLSYLFKQMNYKIISTENMLDESYLKIVNAYNISLYKLVNRQLIYSIRNFFDVLLKFLNFFIRKKIMFTNGDDRNEFFLICEKNQ